MINKTFYYSKIFSLFQLNIFFFQLLILKPKTVIFLLDGFILDKQQFYLSFHFLHRQKVGRKGLDRLLEDMFLISTGVEAEILAIQDLLKAIDQLKVLRDCTYFMLHPDLVGKLSTQTDIHILYCIYSGKNLRTNSIKHGLSIALDISQEAYVNFKSNVLVRESIRIRPHKGLFQLFSQVVSIFIPLFQQEAAKISQKIGMSQSHHVFPIPKHKISVTIDEIPVIVEYAHTLLTHLAVGLFGKGIRPFFHLQIKDPLESFTGSHLRVVLEGLDQEVRKIEKKSQCRLVQDEQPRVPCEGVVRQEAVVTHEECA